MESQRRKRRNPGDSKHILKQFVTGWIPLSGVSRFHAERTALIDKNVPLFFRSLPHVLPLLSPEISNVSVRWAKPPRPIYNALIRTAWMNRFGQFVEVTADVEVDLDALARQNKEKKFSKSFLKHLAAYSLGETIDVALMISELAYPSCIDAEKGGMYLGRTLHHQTKKKSGFWSLRFPNKDDVQWPELYDIDLVKVAKWVKARGIMERELALSNIERALAAFTNLVRLSPINGGEGLFRAMQGLEAFYCEGVGDLRRQLSEKSRLWLGVWSDKKNIVGHLYDARSKFLHGSAGVTFATGSGSSWEEDEALMTELSIAETFAARLLVGTLQKCIREDIGDVEWSYAVKQRASRE